MKTLLRKWVLLTLMAALLAACNGNPQVPQTLTFIPPTSIPAEVSTPVDVLEPSVTLTETQTPQPAPSNTPSPSPTPRATLPVGQTAWNKMPSFSRLPMRGMQAVYDTERNVVVLFGGTDRTNKFLNQTWEYDNATWKQIKTDHSPTPRLWSGMAYDPLRKVVVMLGGRLTDSGILRGDTWEYDGNDWTQIVSGGKPGDRGDGPGLVYDSCRNRIVLFGGKAAFGQNMTWEYDGKAWTPVQTSNYPAERRLTAMVFDSSRCKTVLFGGDSPSLNDTWEFNGSDWEEILTDVTPPGRWGHAMAYNPLTGHVVMFGGYDPATQSLMKDTWIYNGENWQQITTKRTPSAREQQAMTFFGGTGEILMIGGYGADGDWALTEGASTPASTATPENSPSCAFGFTRLNISDFAQPAGEPSLANRIRSEPKIGNNILIGFTPGMFVKLVDGPVCADGFVFWKVESRFIPGGVGWTAEGDGINYFLEPLK